MCTYSSENNQYYCKCIKSENNNEFVLDLAAESPSANCNYLINVQDFFDNISTTNQPTSIHEQSIVLESKGTFKWFTSNFNTENVSFKYKLTRIIHALS